MMPTPWPQSSLPLHTLRPSALAAANTSGGVMGKMIDAKSIVVGVEISVMAHWSRPVRGIA